ncbi:unnamed protein product [Gongylonema pulchrum]|uniref:C2H2-type domain-containing protein n=1 Tax=Gongylonema pulchrum TaxID=637853 RepID=A0A183E593_9BILA|nr:unnamed protein product [Gongylonema pulchrum]
MNDSLFVIVVSAVVKKMSSPSAEELAAEFEKGEAEVGKGGGKRSKCIFCTILRCLQAEQHEHKHPHPGNDTRKIVNYCVSGQEKRKEPPSNAKKE